MKKKDFLWCMLSVIMVSLLSISFMSCGGDDDGNDGFIPPATEDGKSPYVKVNGVETTSLQFEGNFNGKSGVDYKQSVTITSNVAWKASEIPSWLSISPTNGNGNVTMTLYPISENSSSSARSATIRLIGNDGGSASIEVTQSGGLANISVTPANTLALYNQIGWELETSGDVDKYQMIMVTEAVYKNKTDKELLSDLQMDEAEKISSNPVFFYTSDSYGNAIKENTTYYICTVAYDKNDNMGEIIKSRVTTPAYVDIDNDAWVNLEGNYNLNYGYFEFTATKEAYCDSYHILYGNLPSRVSNYPVVFYVFQINYYIKNKTKHWFTSKYDMEIITNYPNTHTFTHYTSTFSTNPLIRICAWGVFKNGMESSDATMLRGDVSASNAPRQVKGQTDEVRRNFVIDSTGMKTLNNQILK